MQRTARCRWLRCCCMRITQLHCFCVISSRHTLEPSKETTQVDFPSASDQDLLLGSTTTSSQSTRELRRQNCWKLWKHRGLSVEQISFVLQMQRDMVITNIIKYEKTMERVDWSRLSKLVGSTTSTTEAIYIGTVTSLQINLVHAMLERGLKASEISHLASLPIKEGNHREVKIQEQNTVFASPPHIEKATCAAFSECSKEEERLFSEKSEEGKEDAEFRNSVYAHEHVECQKTEALTDFSHHITIIPSAKYSTMLDLVRWLRKNQMVVSAFTLCEAQHMLLLLLELLECINMFVKATVVNNALDDDMADRLKTPGGSSMGLAARMHRGLCLDAVILGVHIHVPKRAVEFVVRSLKKSSPTFSNVYHVHISRTPSCTCADFLYASRAGYGYRPCKHLFYIYMVQLSIEKNLEHLMFQAELMEEDLERILDGYY